MEISFGVGKVQISSARAGPTASQHKAIATIRKPFAAFFIALRATAVNSDGIWSQRAGSSQDQVDGLCPYVLRKGRKLTARARPGSSCASPDCQARQTLAQR